VHGGMVLGRRGRRDLAAAGGEPSGSKTRFGSAGHWQEESSLCVPSLAAKFTFACASCDCLVEPAFAYKEINANGVCPWPVLLSVSDETVLTRPVGQQCAAQPMTVVWQSNIAVLRQWHGGTAAAQLSSTCAATRRSGDPAER
jgi:hypothetical protein